MGRADRLCSMLAAALFAVWGMAGLRPDRGLGWDESMHVAGPAARCAFHLAAGEGRAALQALVDDCQNYPFVVPLALAPPYWAARAAGTDPELVLRGTLRLIWAATLHGVFALTFAAATRAGRRREEARLAAWVAFACAALSPLGLAYSGTLFLEVPVTFFAVAALCTRLAERPREWLLGVWIALAFFSKWNFGVLLASAFALDSLLLAALGGRDWRVVLRFVPLLALAAWWFVLPGPGGLEHAAGHRQAFAAYLSGNLDHGRTPWSYRALYLGCAFAPSLRLFAVILLGIVAATPFVRRAGIRLLWLVFLVLAVPVLGHPFLQDRFLLPPAAAAWPLAGLGLARIVGPLRFAPAVLAVAFAACLPFAARDARFLAKRVGLWNEAKADYQTWAFAVMRDLAPDRPLPTGGLKRETYVAVLDALSAAIGPQERFGFVGVSSELSPAAVHLGLLARGAPTARFLRDAAQPAFIDFGADDPAWDAERLAAFAAGFDVLIATEPPDWSDRSLRRWTRAYRERLLAEHGWQARSLGTFPVDRPFAEPLRVEVFTLRPGP